jgi:hypothetical protein
MYLYNQVGSVYSAYVRVNIQLIVIPGFLPSVSFKPASSDKLHIIRGLSLAYAVTVVNCVVLLSHMSLFMILPLDSIMELKRKCKSDNKAKTSCKVMTLDEKIKILDKSRGGMSAAPVGLTFR